MARQRKRTFLRMPGRGTGPAGRRCRGRRGRHHHAHALRPCRHFHRFPGGAVSSPGCRDELLPPAATCAIGRFNHGYRGRRRGRHGAADLQGPRGFHDGDGRARAGLSVHHDRRPFGRAAVRAGARPSAAGSCSPPTPAITTSIWRPAGLPDHVPCRRDAGRLRTLRALAPIAGHIVPGHDPLVMARYPAPSPALEGIAVRLDVAPRG